MMSTVAYVKRRFWNNHSDETINAATVKERNAQIGEQVFVDGVPVYQDGNGAPVEQVSPLGYHVGWAGILFLNVSQMVGTGVFSTRKFFLDVWGGDQGDYADVAHSGVDSESTGQCRIEHSVLGFWLCHCRR
jgi:hypothetical protein